MIKEKKLLMFGAGKIGRSFIAQLFSRSGFEVVFVDIDERVINALNSQKEYEIIIKDTKTYNLVIRNVRGVLATNEEDVIKEIETTQLIAVSVGVKGLEKIAPLLAKGLWNKYKLYPNSFTDIIIAENLRKADQYLKEQIKACIDSDFPIDQFVGFVETSIGKMVPIMESSITRIDPLLVYAEEYNTLILDQKAFLNPVPQVKGLAPKLNMKAWVDRKLFIHNLGHAITAFLGAQISPEKRYLYEILEDKGTCDTVRAGMTEAANVLLMLYPNEFTFKKLSDHIEDLINRFKNRALGDTVFRVGADLPRKLSYNDRLVAPLRIAFENNMPYQNILKGIDAAMHFQAENENGSSLPGDELYLKEYKTKGSSYVLKKYSDLNPLRYLDLFEEVQNMEKRIS
ncbi:mannitol-1-phosphate 5-dehydrogenase [Labilibacter sediminis]|nr:mannitol-1-phosphate 5-dehydrogenase [Labilibacter sediminis]